MKARGFSLVELMVTVVVLAIMVTLAVPSFSNMIERRRVIAAAEDIYQQLAFARMESIKRSRQIRVDFSADDTTTWAYGITDDFGADWETDGCIETITDPATAESCSIDEDGNAATTADRVLYRFTSDPYPGVKMKGASTNTAPVFGGGVSYTTFNYTRGTSASGTIRVYNDTYEMRVLLSVLGRPRLCTPDRAKLPAYPAC